MMYVVSLNSAEINCRNGFRVWVGLSQALSGLVRLGLSHRVTTRDILKIDILAFMKHHTNLPFQNTV